MFPKKISHLIIITSALQSPRFCAAPCGFGHLFENIRDDERFKRIMDEVKAKILEMRRRVEQLERDSSK